MLIPVGEVIYLNKIRTLVNVLRSRQLPKPVERFITIGEKMVFCVRMMNSQSCKTGFIHVF